MRASIERRRVVKNSLRVLAVGSLLLSVNEANHSPPERVHALSVGHAVPYQPPQLEPELTTTTTEPTTTTVPPPPPVTETKPLPKAAPAPSNPPPPPDDPQKIELMKQAGVAESDYGYVDEVFEPESHWNMADISSNGCIGFGQDCPDAGGNYWLEESCPDWQNDPVCQIGRFTVYADQRYGGWPEAAAFRRSHGWW